MRESRTYGSGRGACDETHVPTATQNVSYFPGTYDALSAAVRKMHR
jgi:hypothetical protein